MPTPHPPSPPEGPHGLRILLVEDNEVNQKLAVALLHKEGHQVVVAGTGREGLAALERQPFDLVLMDVQMPELDGLEATALIRQQERGTGRHLPIVAMTACAMKGDRERCLAGGMDGYVSKPVSPSDLFATIARVIPSVPPAPPDKAVTPTVPGAAFDRAGALARAGGDEKLLREIAELFLDSWPGQMAELHQGVGRRDGPVVRRLAHALKGAVGIFGAAAVAEAALRVEKMGQEGTWSGAEDAATELERRLTLLQPALAELVSSPASP